MNNTTLILNALESEQWPNGKTALFSLGTIVATTAVASHFSESNIDIKTYLLRHVQGDWGEVSSEDSIANDLAIKNCTRLLSAYVVANNRIWIITEADRSATTLLFPEEY